MVNLGWVPLELKNDISTDPPVEPFEFSPENFDYLTRKGLSRQNANYL